MSADELKPPQIFVRPAGLDFDHALERLPPQRFAASVERDCHPPAVRMYEDLVRSITSVKGKPVTFECGNQLANRKVPQARIIDGHESDRDGYARLDRDPL
jgi:hypothetical protein